MVVADALWAGGEDDDFAVGAGLLFELQGFFEGVGVGLVHGVLDVGFFNPFAGGVDADWGVAVGNLFDGYDDFHDVTLVHLSAGRCVRRVMFESSLSGSRSRFSLMEFATAAKAPKTTASAIERNSAIMRSTAKKSWSARPPTKKDKAAAPKSAFISASSARAVVLLRSGIEGYHHEFQGLRTARPAA